MRNAFKRRKYARFATACLGALISTGCANFGKPNDLTRINEASYTVYLKEQSRLSFDPVDPAWWRSFDDPVLDRLIEVTANQNIDLAIARSRLEQARSNRRSEIARFGPRINFGGSASAQRQSETSVLPVGDVPGFDADNVVYEAGFDADWELDIFGRNKLDRSSANERLRLAEIDRDAVLVAVLSEVAREYLEFRLAQQEAEKLRQIIEARTAILTMVERRQAVGEASEHEAHLERAALADARARLPDAILRIRTSLVRLDLLTGNQPGKIVQEMTEAAPLPAIPDAAPVGLVSDLLRRREDVRSAEANYAIAENDRALADLEFLPRFSLFGSAGVETVDLADFFDQDSVVASLAGLFSWTLFDGGERDAVRDAARAKSEQAALAYRDAVISALAEVESDAARFVEIAREADMRREERTTRERIVSNEKRKFEVGTTNRVEVKRAQISFYESELRFTRAHAQALINLVALQKSLGGAWETKTPMPSRLTSNLE